MQTRLRKRFCRTCLAVWPTPHADNCPYIWGDMRGKKFGFDSPKLYEALLLVLAERNMSVRALSRELGITNSTISRMQLGKTPDAATVLVVCTWAKIDPSDFLVINHG